tara:strand:- start:1084 stop:1641 length:558 start_codon:yes stop_codon:yes gene_type:complete
VNKLSAFLMVIGVISLSACGSEPSKDRPSSSALEDANSSLNQSLVTAQNSSPNDLGRNLAMLHAQPGTWQIFPADGDRPFRIARKDGDKAHVVRLDFPGGYTSNILALKCNPAPIFRGIDTRVTKNDAEPVRQGVAPDMSDYSLVEVAKQLCSNESQLRTEEGTPARVIETLRSEILTAKRPEGY